MQTTADVNISERLSALNVLTRKQFVAVKRLQLAKWRAMSPLQIRGARPSPERSWKPDNFRRSHDFSAINTNMKVWSQTSVPGASVENVLGYNRLQSTIWYVKSSSCYEGLTRFRFCGKFSFGRSWETRNLYFFFYIWTTNSVINQSACTIYRTNQ